MQHQNNSKTKIKECFKTEVLNVPIEQIVQQSVKDMQQLANEVLVMIKTGKEIKKYWETNRIKNQCDDSNTRIKFTWMKVTLTFLIYLGTIKTM